MAGPYTAVANLIYRWRFWRNSGSMNNDVDDVDEAVMDCSIVEKGR